jgi:hypothetical protein
MHQQLWGYKVEWKSVSSGTGGKKVEYHWNRQPRTADKGLSSNLGLGEELTTPHSKKKKKKKKNCYDMLHRVIWKYPGNGIENSEDLGVDGKMILEWILGK